MRALRYAFDEAVLSLWRGRRSGALSMATIAVALFVLGAFLMATTNLERLGDEWGRSAEMSVYLTDEATASDRDAVQAVLASDSVVAGHQFVTKDEALSRFKTTFADLAGAVGSIEGNPLPASYEVRLEAAPGSSEAIAALAAKLSQTPGVSDVRYDRQWLERLLSAVGLVRVVGLSLGIVLTIAAALTVANVVRLALWARRDELEIMQLVGAPQVFIRGPFVMEGVLQGGIGALLALAALALAFLAVRGSLLLPLAEGLNLSGVRFLAPGLCLLLVGGGTLVGCLGGLVAAAGRPMATR
jgi:cell division transport system permease protein